MDGTERRDVYIGQLKPKNMGSFHADLRALFGDDDTQARDQARLDAIRAGARKLAIQAEAEAFEPELNWDDEEVQVAPTPLEGVPITERSPGVDSNSAAPDTVRDDQIPSPTVPYGLTGGYAAAREVVVAVRAALNPDNNISADDETPPAKSGVIIIPPASKTVPSERNLHLEMHRDKPARVLELHKKK